MFGKMPKTETIFTEKEFEALYARICVCGDKYSLYGAKIENQLAHAVMLLKARDILPFKTEELELASRMLTAIERYVYMNGPAQTNYYASFAVNLSNNNQQYFLDIITNLEERLVKDMSYRALSVKLNMRNENFTGDIIFSEANLKCVWDSAQKLNKTGFDKVIEGYVERHQLDGELLIAMKKLRVVFGLPENEITIPPLDLVLSNERTSVQTALATPV